MIEEWQLLKETQYKLDFRKVAKRTYRLPDGSTHDYDIILNRPVAVILALTEDRQVILAKQFRPGPDKILLEMPAGIVDAGETPQEAAERELLEETGYKGEIEYVGSAYRDAYATVVLHTFVAKNCRKVQELMPSTGEFIEVVLLSIPEFRAHVKSGQLTDVAPGYQSLDYLGLL